MRSCQSGIWAAAIVARPMVTAPVARRSPFPLPPPGAPLRLAFVGQATFFRACALEDDIPGVRTSFFEYRRDGDARALRSALEGFAPHAIVVFRPDVVPSGVFAGLGAVILGFLPEPLPRTLDGEIHEHLARRLWELGHVDPA